MSELVTAPARFREYDPMTQLAALVAMVMAVPRVPERAHALLVFPGLGETWRERAAIDLWQNGEHRARHLLFAGENPNEKKGFLRTIEGLRKSPFFLRSAHGVHTQVHAQNTKEQAEWATEKVSELGIVSVALFVSPYHMTRAYLTLLAAFLRHGIRIPIIPAPVPVSPETVTPEYGVDAWTMLPGELMRIPQYQEKRDVASFEDVMNYLNWLWEHPILRKEE